jgi:uncharacterized protein (DUF433 family)
MSTHSELLTVTEAAAVAGVTVRDVNRVIDEHIVPERFYSVKGGRWLKSDACAFVRFYFVAEHKLTAHERTHVIYALSTAKPQSWTYEDAFLTVRLEPFFEATEAQHERLMQARDLVIEDPEILSGAPVIRGTRIPVYDVAASVAAGVGSDRLKEAYPGLNNTQIELASLYAEANPPRGRPKRVHSVPPGLRVALERKAARRRLLSHERRVDENHR